jgi:hypothetical protein
LKLIEELLSISAAQSGLDAGLIELHRKRHHDLSIDRPSGETEIRPLLLASKKKEWISVETRRSNAF